MLVPAKNMKKKKKSRSECSSLGWTGFSAIIGIQTKHNSFLFYLLGRSSKKVLCASAFVGRQCNQVYDHYFIMFDRDFNWMSSQVLFFDPVLETHSLPILLGHIIHIQVFMSVWRWNLRKAWHLDTYSVNVLANL